MLGVPPPSKRPSQSLFFYRPQEAPAGATDSEAYADVFEKCAARCQAKDPTAEWCWMFSMDAATRSCTLHTGMWKMTSFTV